MLIGSNRKLANVSSLSLSIFDCDLDSVNKFKYLGIMLASDFTWSDHVEYVISKVNQRLGLLRRIKDLLTFTAHLLFYKYGLLTKCEVKMAGYWPSSFFACLWTPSRSINTQKKNSANIKPS